VNVEEPTVIPGLKDLIGCNETRTVSAQSVLNACWPIPIIPMRVRVDWRRGVVVSEVRRMNEVNARRARLVPGCVTVFGRVYHLGM